jgi:two-component system chemotaxis response regulator CheB
MGDDGARGLGRIKSSGGYTLAQDEESCVVFGMPRAAIELGNASEVAPLQSIPGLLTSLVNPATRNPPAPAGGSFVSRGRSRY